MFGTRWLLLLLVVGVLGFLALSSAGATRGSAPPARYVVQPGDTLWAIATARYAGDPREAVWEIERANGLDGDPLTPGTVLRLP